MQIVAHHVCETPKAGATPPSQEQVAPSSLEEPAPPGLMLPAPPAVPRHVLAALQPAATSPATAAHKIHSCPECEFTTKRRFKLTAHLKYKHGPIVNKHGPISRLGYKCSKCSFETFVRGRIKNHLNEKHGGIDDYEFTLQPIKKKKRIHKFRTEDENQQQLKSIMKQCKHCDYKSKREDHMSFHMKKKHSVPCNFCQFRGSRKTIHTHVAREHSFVPGTIQVCTKYCTAKYYNFIIPE